MSDLIYPIYSPYMTGKEKALVADCIDSTWISSKGKYVAEFEQRFAAFVGAKRGVSVCNGTVALHVALLALGIGPGDEVLVPSLTYVASANAVTYTGAKPVLVDSEPEFWQLDVADAERRITPRTRAIMPVHLYGHPCDMAAVMRLAEKHRLLVLEDCAEAIGTEFDGVKVGTFGHAAAFSFFGNKTITTGEGGMVLTSNDAVADLAARYRGQGLSGSREYWHDLVGYNYRMTNVAAAIGCAQLDAVDVILRRKHDIAARYRDLLTDLPVEVQGCAPGSRNSYWMVSVLVHSARDRDPLRRCLREHGIETRPLFHPIHTLPIYVDGPTDFPVSVDLSSRGLNLPSYPGLTDRDVETICGRVRAYFR